MNGDTAAAAPTKRLPHYVAPEPFDPYVAEKLTPEQERFYLASQWRMMWLRLRRHRVAVISGAFLGLLYFSVLISELLAPYELSTRHTDFIYAPPQSVHLFHEGRFVGPFVYPYTMRLNMENLKREYEVDRTRPQKLRFFCHGDDRYEF